MMLPTKYQGSRLYGFRREYFHMFFSILEFKESDVLPGQTEVKQGKFVEFISQTKGYFRQGCGNNMPDLSDLVPFHSGQVENLFLLVLGQV